MSSRVCRSQPVHCRSGTLLAQGYLSIVACSACLADCFLFSQEPCVCRPDSRRRPQRNRCSAGGLDRVWKDKHWVSERLLWTVQARPNGSLVKWGWSNNCNLCNDCNHCNHCKSDDWEDCVDDSVDDHFQGNRLWRTDAISGTQITRDPSGRASTVRAPLYCYSIVWYGMV